MLGSTNVVETNDGERTRERDSHHDGTPHGTFSLPVTRRANADTDGSNNERLDLGAVGRMERSDVRDGRGDVVVLDQIGNNFWDVRRCRPQGGDQSLGPGRRRWPRPRTGEEENPRSGVRRGRRCCVGGRVELLGPGRGGRGVVVKKSSSCGGRGSDDEQWEYR